MSVAADRRRAVIIAALGFLAAHARQAVQRAEWAAVKRPT
jgi:hypothetical protein